MSWLKQKDFILTADHIKLLRQLLVVWLSIEAGAPSVHYEEPYGSPNITADVARILEIEPAEAGFSIAQQKYIEQLHDDMALVLPILAHVGELAPGEYHYENRLKNYPFVLQFSDNAQLQPLLAADTINFHFKTEHIQLIRGLSFRGLSVDPKRPYGDMTYFEIDMADILGIPFTRDAVNQPQFSEAQLAYFNQLHEEMLFALQTFIHYATIEPGPYYRPTRYSLWER